MSEIQPDGFSPEEHESKYNPDEIHAAQIEMAEQLYEGNLDEACYFRDEFGLSKESFQSAAKEAVIRRLNDSFAKGAISIINVLEKNKDIQSKEIIQSQEVQLAAKKSMSFPISQGRFDEALMIKDFFQLSEQSVQLAAREGFLYSLNEGDPKKILRIKDEFKLPEEFVQSAEAVAAAEKGIIRCLNHNDDYLLNNALKIKDMFNQSDEIMQSQGVQSAAKEAMIYWLKRNNFNNAFKIKNAFNTHLETSSVPENDIRNKVYNCLEGLQFDNFHQIIELFPSDLDLKRFLPPFAELDQMWRQLYQDQNYWSANKLREIIERAGYSISDQDLLEKSKQGLEREQQARQERSPRPISLETKYLPQEIAKFYLDETIMRNIEAFRYELGERKEDKEPQELSRIPDQIGLNQLEGQTKDRLESIFNWVREYLVNAVYSELKDQTRIDRQELVQLPDLSAEQKESSSPVDDFLKMATNEEIRTYLKQTEVRFNESGWSYNYGGKPWAKIAQTAYELWKEAVPFRQKLFWIDRVFDLEHNTGMIFDKRKDRIEQESKIARRILDTKFKAKDSNELKAELFGILSSDTNTNNEEWKKTEATFIDTANKTLEALEKAPRRPLGGE